jgi:ribonuclease BN (tRNA processing enzyme)
VDDDFYLQVLGSGGPIADDGRASSAYLVWVDGKSKILIDAGGGAFLRFGEAGAEFDELEHVGISHFHTDHSADLVTFLKTGFFSSRKRPLTISGPGAGGPFPALADYLHSTIGEGGAYAYLGGYIDGSGGLVKLEPTTIDSASREAVPVANINGIRITAMGVPHGIVPAIAYRVQIGDRGIVFASDQNGNDEEFVDFARDADLLIMHMVVPENIQGAGRSLHAPPSRIGQIAAAANAGSLVLSHFMARSLPT